MRPAVAADRRARSRCAARRGTPRPRRRSSGSGRGGSYARIGAAARRSPRPPARTAVAGVLGLEHGGVAGLLEDLAHEPVDAREAQLDDDRAVRQLLDRRCAPRAPSGRARARSTRARRARPATSPVRGQPSTSAAGSTSGRGVKRSSVTSARLIAVQPEVARRRLARGVVGGDVPALAAVDQRVGLDASAGELVLVGLVVVQLEQPAAGDRACETTAAISESSPAGVATCRPCSVGSSPSAATIFSRARSASPRGCARRSGRSRRRAPWPRPAAAAPGARSCREYGSGSTSIVAVVGDLGVEDVGAAAEVDDVEDVDVLAQLGSETCRRSQHVGELQAPAGAPGLDQDRRERHEPGEALGADRGVALRRPVAVASASAAPGGGRPTGAASSSAPSAWRSAISATRSRDLVGQLRRAEDARVLAEAQDPGATSWRASAYSV